MTEVKQTRIFLSYARKDVVKVNKLYEKLKHYGFSPWQDHKDLIGGMDWMEEIIETINNCAFFVACISKNTYEKRPDNPNWVLVREINEALDVVKFRRKGTMFIIPVRLENVDFPEEFKKYQGIDLFASGGFEKLITALRYGLKQLGIDNPLNLRSQPLENFTPAEVGQMIRERNFYDSSIWPDGQGIKNEYEQKRIDGDFVVIDHTTGLMWQQRGSEKETEYRAAKDYIKELNEKKFAGYSDWRLPTLEEAMSLMEPTEKSGDYEHLYIDPVFYSAQVWIWTADGDSGSPGWFVNFMLGYCDFHRVGDSNYVRAVRSVH